jgi:hypothetical protein
MFHLGDLANVFEPVVDIAIQSFFESIIKNIIKIINLALNFLFARLFNTPFHFVVHSQLNQWDIQILPSLCKMHFQRGELLYDSVNA